LSIVAGGWLMTMMVMVMAGEVGVNLDVASDTVTFSPTVLLAM